MPLFFSILLSILPNVYLKSQCAGVHQSLEQRVEEATYVIEGKVISQNSFWDEQAQNIFTANTIELYKLFKGNTAEFNSIEIITRGGQVDEDLQIDFPSLRLSEGDVGIFLLHDNQAALGEVAHKNVLYLEPAQVNQSYVGYDLNSGIAFDAFHTFQDIEREVYSLIQRNTNTTYQNIKAFDFDKASKRFTPALHKTISNFSPTTITAGTESILTINGSGFGATPGRVEFTNADEASGTVIDVAAVAAQIISWSNNMITVEVPTDAGTGQFEVITSSGTIFTSASELTIGYAHLTATSTDPRFTWLVNDNGSGGYTFQYYTDFANGTDLAGASEAFQRALQTHCLASSVNWLIGSNSSVDVIASDGVNIVRFDNGNELPSSTLGRVSNRWTLCGEWYLTEVDIVFNDGFNWDASEGSTSSPQYSFESVAVHELGHAHQLGHTLNGSGSSGDVMFPVTSIGANKIVLLPNDEAGTDAVFQRSSTSTACFLTRAMIASDCGTLPVELLSFTGENRKDYNHLNWATASEINNAGFEVQKSTDGENWMILDFVKGAGTSLEQQKYQLHDYELSKTIQYYRLKQVDTDGGFEYSDVLVIKSEKEQEDHLYLSPNPSPKESIQITSNQLGQLQVFSLTGQLVLDIPDFNDTTLDISWFSKGVYFVKMGGLIEKLIVQ